MKDKGIRAVCPLCGRAYHGVPALSRTDNATPICPDCGTRQALENMGVKADESAGTKVTIPTNVSARIGRGGHAIAWAMAN